MYKSMAITVSRSSEATHEIEFCTPRKPAAVPVLENIDVHSTVKGGRRKETVHAVLCHSASVRSGSGIIIIIIII